MERQGRSILIVDDDAWTRYALTRILRHRGLFTAAAANVKETLAMLNTKPDCVILDLHLPDGCGGAILRAIRERKLSCRVVICSAVADAATLDALSRLAPDAYFQKPVEPEDLAEACCRR